MTEEELRRRATAEVMAHFDVDELNDHGKEVVTLMVGFASTIATEARAEGARSMRERAAACCEREASACLSDIVPGDEIGRKLMNAKAGALLTVATDLRALPDFPEGEKG